MKLNTAIGFGVDTHIDQVFYPDLSGHRGAYSAGRLASIKAVSLILLSIAVYLGFSEESCNHPGHTYFFIFEFILLQAPTNFALTVQTSFGLASHMRIADHGAVALVLLLCQQTAVLCGFFFKLHGGFCWRLRSLYLRHCKHGLFYGDGHTQCGYRTQISKDSQTFLLTRSSVRSSEA